MNRALKLFFLFLITIQIIGCSANKQQNIPYIFKSFPKNIDYSSNKLQFANKNTLGALGRKWNNENTIINIAHFGDSHIQNGLQIGPLRDMFQAIKGNAGRGMIFPYAIAKTYSQEDFTSSFTGKWKTSNSIHQPPKFPLGISGFVAKTNEKYAQVKFSFKRPLANGVNIRIFMENYNGAYTLLLSNGRETRKADILATNSQPFIDFKLNGISKDLILTIQTNDEHSEFVLYGISLNNLNRTGIIYHNLGVGGATYSALLQQKLFDRQFPLINADLVILDWGTNDLIYTNKIDSELEWTIRQTIRKVRKSNPSAAILLSSVQEANYKGQNINISAKYATLLKKIAREEKTLFYDWYAISGKSGSINYWRAIGFASKDGIHLNGKGYRVKAKLLGDAILNALQNQ